MIGSIQLSKDKLALGIGVSLLLMTVLGIFSFGVAMPEFNQLMSSRTLNDLMQEKGMLYRSMLFVIGTVVVLDIIVAWLLTSFFKEVSQKLAYYSGLLRLLYSLVFGVALFFLIISLFAEENHAAHYWINMKRFHWVWNFGLGVFFGPHLILVALLMKKYGRFHFLLWSLTGIAGISYTLLHIIKLVVSNPDSYAMLEQILILPMSLGEIVLAFWFLFKVILRTKF